MIDVNLRGALYGIAAALPVFAQQGKGHVINVISTAGLKIVPTMGVYAATKNALRTATEALRQEAGAKLRVTEVSPGFIDTSFADSSITDPDVKAMINQQKERLAISPNAIARAIAFAIEHPRMSRLAASLSVRPRKIRAGYGSAHCYGRSPWLYERDIAQNVIAPTSGASGCRRKCGFVSRQGL